MIESLLDWLSAIALIILSVFLFAAALCLTAAMFLIAVSILKFAIEDFREIWGKQKPKSIASSGTTTDLMLTDFLSMEIEGDRFSHHLSDRSDCNPNMECDR